MSATDRLLERAYDNAIGMLRALSMASRAGRQREDDCVVLLHTGSSVASFNPVFITRVPRDVSALFRRIDAFTHVAGTPAVVYARPEHASALELDAAAAGFQRGPDEYGLVLRLAEATIPPPREDLQVIVVRDVATLAAFVETSARAFDAPRDWLGQPDVDRLLAVEGLTLYLGLVGNEPVSTGALFVTGEVAGVHVIGTVPEHRRRGLGEAMTWHVIRDGALRGCTLSALTSSDMSERMYRRMGFRPVARFAVWERPEIGELEISD